MALPPLPSAHCPPRYRQPGAAWATSAAADCWQAADMARRFGITVDCTDPAALGAFWCALLGYQQEPPPAGYPDWAAYDAANGISAEQANAGMTIVDPSGSG